ncbi:MAG: three-Cys-motif partner protein TcmP [Halobacteriaceae archaeon]
MPGTVGDLSTDDRQRALTGVPEHNDLLVVQVLVFVLSNFGKGLTKTPGGGQINTTSIILFERPLLDHMDTTEYITQRIKSLKENSNEIREQSTVTNDFDSWSVLKLILHSAAVNMYTTVCQNNKFDDLYYIDALAGSGVSTYDDGDACFLGSPIIAAKVADNPFDKMYFIEHDSEKAEALERRLDFVFENYNDVAEPEEWQVWDEDANEAIPEIIEDIWQSSGDTFNYFCFVDNQGTNMKWSSIDEMIPKPWGDLLINIPTASAIGRNITSTPVPQETYEFFCCDLDEIEIPETGVRSRAIELYQDCLSRNGRPVQEIVNVDSGVGSYEYDLIYATRDIPDGNEYMKVIEYVKEFIEDIDGEDVDNILDILYGNQMSATRFMPSKEIDDEIFQDHNVEDDQTGLTEF